MTLELSHLARGIAMTAHLGQKDKGGEPYIGHPARIALAVERANYEDEAVAVAWLHDVVEDTPWDLHDLMGVGFPPEVINAVEAITHRSHESRADYYTRVKENRLAHIVKWYDVEDNASEKRMALLAPETQERLKAKYVKARELLGGPPA